MNVNVREKRGPCSYGLSHGLKTSIDGRVAKYQAGYTELTVVVHVN